MDRWAHGHFYIYEMINAYSTSEVEIQFTNELS